MTPPALSISGEVSSQAAPTDPTRRNFAPAEAGGWAPRLRAWNLQVELCVAVDPLQTQRADREPRQLGRSARAIDDHEPNVRVDERRATTDQGPLLAGSMRCPSLIVISASRISSCRTSAMRRRDTRDR